MVVVHTLLFSAPASATLPSSKKNVTNISNYIIIVLSGKTTNRMTTVSFHRNVQKCGCGEREAIHRFLNF